MIKNNKGKLIASSVVLLLPAILSFIFDDNLPDIWGTGGLDSSRAAIFILPAVLLVLHWGCILFSAKDPENSGQNKKVFGMVIWAIPVISLFANGVIYAAFSGMDQLAQKSVFFIFGLMFAVIGNYMPKCKQNFTIGIKIKWTLENEENWNATHRFGGKVMFISGLLMLACVFLPLNVGFVLLGALLLVCILSVCLYSYLFYKKQVKAGTFKSVPIMKKAENKRFAVISGIVAFVILGFALFMAFSGDIQVKYDESSFTVGSVVWSDITVEYSAVDKIEYRENNDVGTRINGFAGVRVLAGGFRNDEFGNYTRYSYMDCGECIVLSIDDKILVITGEDSEMTRIIYDELVSRIKNAE